MTTEDKILAELLRHPDGLTNKDISEKMSYHGPVSGATSNLHFEQKIARLEEKRGRWIVYVHPVHVDGRKTVPFQHRSCPNCGHDLTERYKK